MSDLEILQRPELRRPILIAAWSGWNDAGEAATSAIRFMLRRWRSEAVARIDPEPFYDFTQARPRVQLDHGQRTIEWPANDTFAHRSEGAGPDLLMLSGVEPHLGWQAYTDAILELCQAFDVSAVITVGALLAEFSHTRPVRVNGSSEDEELRTRFGLSAPQQPGYQGPTGIVGVVNTAVRDAALPTASMWANVPYYLNASPNPKGSLALLEMLNGSLQLDLQLHDMEVFAARFDAQIAEEVAKNPKMAEYARQLEEQEDEEEDEPTAPAAPASDLPDAESMVEELEQFLREQRTEGDDGDEAASAT